jgi:hypothetical protein
MNDFKATASYLLPYDPVSKNRAAGAKRGLSSILDITGKDNADISSVSQGGRNKTLIGKSRIEFRYHKPQEYNLLLAAQKSKLKEFRDNKKTNPGRQGSLKKPCNNTSKENKHKK